MLPSMDLDEYVNFVRQVDKALILRSLGIAIVFAGCNPISKGLDHSGEGEVTPLDSVISSPYHS